MTEMLVSKFEKYNKTCTLSAFQTLRVYTEWTHQRQFDGVKHGALVLEHMLINRSIHIGRAAL